HRQVVHARVHVAGRLGPDLGQRVVIDRLGAILDPHRPVTKLVAGDCLHRAGEDQPLHLVLDRRFTDVVQTYYVWTDQHFGKVGRVRVGAEVDARVDALDGAGDRVAVGRVADDMVLEAGRRVAGEAAYLVAAPCQVARQRLANGAGRASDEDTR